MQLDIPCNNMEFQSIAYIKTPFSNDRCVYVRLYDMFADALTTRLMLENPPYYIDDSNIEILKLKFALAATDALEYCRNFRPEEVYSEIHDSLLEEAELADIGKFLQLS